MNISLIDFFFSKETQIGATSTNFSNSFPAHKWSAKVHFDGVASDIRGIGQHKSKICSIEQIFLSQPIKR